MKKIRVVGTTGSGKTTFSRKLSKKTGIRYVQLDELFWKPNWTESNDDEFFDRIENALSGDSWIVDGNYGRANHITFKDVDTVIWLDLPYLKNLYQLLSRAVSRSISGKELWPKTGNRETFKKLFSKDSILFWFKKSYPVMKKRYEALLNDPDYSHINFYRFKSRREVDKFLSQ